MRPIRGESDRENIVERIMLDYLFGARMRGKFLQALLAPWKRYRNTDVISKTEPSYFRQLTMQFWILSPLGVVHFLVRPHS